ncbi:DoxX-like family protein [Pseudoalteromonas piscicida]|uniref:DoxX-like family protein n=1 Tax=Pseudoalteromonas piscicida TaxID=43662 RepID=UPI003C7C5D06
MHPVQIARYIITFAWLYHGLAPKLIQIAPLEQLMSGSAGLSPESTYIFIKAAGIAEVIWAIIFYIFYKVRVVVFLNILALIFLLLAVALLQPQLLIEAFNPVTTNVPLIALSLIILNGVKSKEDSV